MKPKPQTKNDSPKQGIAATLARKAQLRVEVARDVLKSLPQMRADTGQFAHNPSTEAYLKAQTQPSQKAARTLQKGCYVCALGACLLSTVALDNKFDLGAGHSAEAWTPYQDDLLKRLRKLFSAEQLILIENAYETGGGYLQLSSNDAMDEVGLKKYGAKLPVQIYDAIAFGERYKDDKARMRAIMRNIIDNGGQFLPGASKTPAKSK